MDIVSKYLFPLYYFIDNDDMEENNIENKSHRIIKHIKNLENKKMKRIRYLIK